LSLPEWTRRPPWRLPADHVVVAVDVHAVLAVGHRGSAGGVRTQVVAGDDVLVAHHPDPVGLSVVDHQPADFDAVAGEMEAADRVGGVYHDRRIGRRVRRRRRGVRLGVAADRDGLRDGRQVAGE
jgi:hypothetical protein